MQATKRFSVRAAQRSWPARAAAWRRPASRALTAWARPAAQQRGPAAFGGAAVLAALFAVAGGAAAAKAAEQLKQWSASKDGVDGEVFLLAGTEWKFAGQMRREDGARLVEYVEVSQKPDEPWQQLIGVQIDPSFAKFKGHERERDVMATLLARLESELSQLNGASVALVTASPEEFVVSFQLPPMGDEPAERCVQRAIFTDAGLLSITYATRLPFDEAARQKVIDDFRALVLTA